MTELIRFADFELDEARFELRRAGSAVALQPKVLRMLLHLVAQRARAVSTTELFSVLWPGERVGLASIKRAVIGVRRALGEAGDSQHSVRTVRGFGYQFVLPVSSTAQASSLAVSATATSSSAGEDDVSGLGMAETLPLYGRASEGIRRATPGSLPNLEPQPRADNVPERLARSAVDALPEQTRAQLAAASVLAAEFSLGVLADVLSCPVEQVFAGLCAPLAARLLEEVKGSVGRYRFSTPQLRAELYDALPPSERARLHGRAGSVLEARGPGLSDAQLSEIAAHFCQAAPTYDDGRALVYSLRLAQAARARLAHEEAVAHFERALQLLELVECSHPQRMEVLLELGEELSQCADTQSARARLLAAVAIARQLGRDDVLVRVAVLLAAPFEAGNVDLAQVSLLREARALLPADDARAPLLDAMLAKSLCYAGDLEERAALALRAYESAQGLPPAARAVVLERCHEALSEPHHRGTRLAIGEQLTRLAHRLGDPTSVLRSCICQIQDSLERGDLAAVDAALETFELTAESARSATFHWYGHAYRSMRASIAGDLGSAERHARDALALKSGVPEGEHVYAVQMNGIWLLQGKLKEAEAITRAMSARYPRLAGWRALLGSAQAATGRRELARQTFHRLMDQDLTSLHRDPFVLSALAPCAQLCAEVGDAASARWLYEAILPHVELHATVHLGIASWGSTQTQLGLLAARMNELKRAVAHFEAAVSIADRMPSPTFACLSRVGYARVLVTQGSDAERLRGTDLLRTAHALALRHELGGVAALALQLGASRSGARPSSALTAEAAPLVARWAQSAVGKTTTRELVAS